MNEPNMIAFTRGVPPVESFPIKRLEECAQIVLERDGNRLLQYGKAAGYEPLRESLADQYHTPKNQVIVGQGSLQLLDTLVRVTLSARDCVFVEQPSYDRVLTIFRRSGTQLESINLQNGLLDMAQLEAKLQSGLRPRYFYTIPDFQNPSGAVMPLEARRKLIELSQTYGFYLIEDGPYRDLRYHGQALPALFELAPDRVVFMSSYSKLISPGLRVGFMILPPELVEDVRKFAEDTYINASYLNQAIAYDFIRRGWLDENLDQLKELYRPRLGYPAGHAGRRIWRPGGLGQTRGRVLCGPQPGRGRTRPGPQGPAGCRAGAQRQPRLFYRWRQRLYPPAVLRADAGTT